MTRETGIDLQGMKRLADAVLLKAMEDLFGGSRRSIGEVSRWIDQTGDTTFSFGFWCRVAKLNPEKLRQQTKRKWTRGLWNFPQMWPSDLMTTRAHSDEHAASMADRPKRLSAGRHAVIGAAQPRPGDAALSPGIAAAGAVIPQGGTSSWLGAA